ncbi:MAG: ATP phosphoribosyltransferase regulatory subunit [Pseudomonadota bacterium]
MSPDRAYLSEARIGPGLAAVAAELARLDALFAQAGAEAVEPAILQPASALLNLYGEDVRARAYVVHDPIAGERMLRPDFTAPIARLHLDRHGEAAAETAALYRYAGPVFRASVPGQARPSEYLQAGVEMIGPRDPVAADVEVFALVRAALGPLAERAAVTLGDLAIVFAAIDGLSAPRRLRDGLRRRFWRPPAFRRALAALAPDRPPPTLARRALLDAAASADGLAALLDGASEPEGARPLSAVQARALALSEDAGVSLPAAEAARLAEILAVRAPAPEALARLRALDPGALASALDRFETRLNALAASGADPEAMTFDAAFGRALEYYDGFVFEFALPDAPRLPPLAGGGRYDALLARLEGPPGLPGVGAILRPEACLAVP